MFRTMWSFLSEQNYLIKSIMIIMTLSTIPRKIFHVEKLSHRPTERSNWISKPPCLWIVWCWLKLTMDKIFFFVSIRLIGIIEAIDLKSVCFIIQINRNCFRSQVATTDNNFLSRFCSSLKMWCLEIGLLLTIVNFGFDWILTNFRWVRSVFVYSIQKQFNVRRWSTLVAKTFVRSFDFSIKGSTVSPKSEVQILHDHRLFPYRIISKPIIGIYQNLTKVDQDKKKRSFSRKCFDWFLFRKTFGISMHWMMNPLLLSSIRLNRSKINTFVFSWAIC